MTGFLSTDAADPKKRGRVRATVAVWIHMEGDLGYSATAKREEDFLIATAN